MYNVNEMTINEIREMYLTLFSDIVEEHLENTPLKDLILEMEEEEASFSKEFKENENFLENKHIRSKKKKYYKEDHVKKSNISKHNPKWKIPTNKKVTDETTTNRSYLKKKSSGYIKLKPQKSL